MLSSGNGNPKQILIFNKPAWSFMYTVPVNRKFVGHIYNQSGAAAYLHDFTSGAQVDFTPPSMSSWSSAMTMQPITLLYGMGVREGSTGSSTRIFGIEYDA
jgi:hypothetical protein